MPVRDQPPQKKRKLEQTSKQSYKYVSAADIRRVFSAQSESGLIEGLTALRNQLTVKPNEPPVQINDERLVLVKEWLEGDPGAQELFRIWEGANARQMSLLAVVVGVFSALITLLSSHYTYHSYGQPIIRNLLSQQWTQHLNVYVSGQHTELILVTLKLFNSMSNFAGGRERKSVLDAFAWEMKSVPKLLHMRRRVKGDDVDMLARPDIRTLYVLLVLSFIDPTTTSSIKATFLEHHRDAFTSIFKGLSQDTYSVIRRVLEVCWSGLWADAKLKRTLKIQVFSEATLSQLTKIYERNAPEGADQESIPADVVHHFLLALCSRPGVGLCFHDRGWYARESDGDQQTFTEAEEHNTSDVGFSKGSKVHNKILANILKMLKVNEDPRQQELALKILAACPELVASYWSNAGLALEPRLSSKWLANIAFFGAVVSLPVPVASFFLQEGGSGSTSLYQPSPPPISAIIENILPTSHIKTHLSRGLQAPSPLVQHTCALSLAKCLYKYEKVVHAFQEVERALEEDEDGLWARRCREVEREVRKRVPDFQVIVGFLQRFNEPNTATPKTAEQGKQKDNTPNATRTALLADSAHRLLWLYHRLLPSVVAEARFDAGKLLQAIEDMLSQGGSTNSASGLDTLRQLHVLRLLRESQHFTWSSKSGSKHSNFHILLKAYVITSVPAVRSAIAALLRHILAPGVLFQHDPDEIALWLDALPHTFRASVAKAPDGAPLTDEGEGVIAFLDDCVQRCVKTPYKYVEELQAIYIPHASASTSSIGERPEAFPSPLIATVVEQLGAKLRGILLTASDTLALFSFVRKLVLRMAGKSVDLGLPKAFTEKIRALVENQTLFPDSPIMEGAIRREVQLLSSSMAVLQEASATPIDASTPGVHEFLAQVEKMPEPDSESARRISAYELVDWFRLIGPKLHASDMKRLVASIERFHRPALREFLEYCDPRQGSLWEDVGLLADLPRLTTQIRFHVLLLHCTNEVVKNHAFQNIIVETICTDKPRETNVKHAIQLVLHRLAQSHVEDESTQDWVRILANIVHRTQTAPDIDTVDILLSCFESEALKILSSRPLPAVIREAFGELLDISFKAGGEDISELFAKLTGRWVLLLRESLDNMSEDERATAVMWFRYLDAPEVLGILNYLADKADHSGALVTKGVIGDIVTATANTLSRDMDATTQALPVLCRLQVVLPRSSDLEKLISAATLGSLPLAHDGYLPPRPFTEWSIASIVPGGTRRWALRLQQPSPLSLAPVLGEASMSDASTDIIAHLLYQQRIARSAVAEWLASPASTSCSTTHLVRILFAFHDAAASEQDFPLHAHFSRVARVVSEGRHTHQLPAMSADCVVKMVASTPSSHTKYFKILSKELPSVAPEKLSAYSLSVAQGCLDHGGPEAVAFAQQMLDLGLKWAVRWIADSRSTIANASTILSSLASLIQSKIAVKSHLAEPVIAAVTQDGLSNVEGIRFARLLASSTHLKPATVNKFLQTTVQHAKFYEHCAISTEPASPRDDIAVFLHALFHLHPSNTCQPSHIEPLRNVYGGTLGSADRRIISIFQLFEATRKTSTASLFSKWSTSASVSSESALEAIQSLDPSRVLKTCLEFPDWRKQADDEEGRDPSSGQLYDPVFILLLFAQMLSDSTPSAALAWVQLFRSNVASLVLRTLSSKDVTLREIAWAQIAALYRALENADMQEKPHVLHILNLLKDLPSTAPSTDDEAPRLPAYTTLLLAHAFRALFYPSNFIYPLTARFLLQRPTLDSTDVPMLFGMLYSASDDWKKERAWIVRFLADGMVSSEEWRVLKRRHTWDLLASLLQSEERDRALRRGVLEVLANVTCNGRATTSLLLRQALLAWLEAQLHTMRGEEAVAWVRIIGNILAVANAPKVEAATNGAWRAAVGRCMKTILHHTACTQSVFIAAVPVLLRLALLPGPPVSHIPGLLERSLHWLEPLEADVAVPTSGQLSTPFQPSSDTPSAMLHRSQHLFDPPPSPTIELWGGSVEALWRVCMTLPSRSDEWDALSHRLLIWRAIAGAERSRVGEWARREVVENLQRCA